MPETIAARISRDELNAAETAYETANRAMLEKYQYDQYATSAVRRYSAEDYRPINGLLRGEDVHDVEKIRDIAKRVQDFLLKSPKAPGAVSRGVKLTDAQLAAYTPGAIVTEHAFVSTTVELRTAHEFGTSFDPALTQVVFHIRQRSGVAIDGFSVNHGEKEVLLPAGLRFKVIARILEGDFTAIHMEEI